MNALARLLARGPDLLADRRGSFISTTMSLAISSFVVGGVFLVNTQLNKGYVQRDMVDHAAALAADAANKILCANPASVGGSPLGVIPGARAAAVLASVQPVLSLVAGVDECTIEYLRADGDSVSQVVPDQPLDVQVTCVIPCSVPFAAGKICDGTPPSLRYVAKQTIQPVGCDMKGE